jgi:hypothetical protein
VLLQVWQRVSTIPTLTHRRYWTWLFRGQVLRLGRRGKRRWRSNSPSAVRGLFRRRTRVRHDHWGSRVARWKVLLVSGPRRWGGDGDARVGNRSTTSIVSLALLYSPQESSGRARSFHLAEWDAYCAESDRYVYADVEAVRWRGGFVLSLSLIEESCG